MIRKPYKTSIGPVKSKGTQLKNQQLMGLIKRYYLALNLIEYLLLIA